MDSALQPGHRLPPSRAGLFDVTLIARDAAEDATGPSGAAGGVVASGGEESRETTAW